MDRSMMSPWLAFLLALPLAAHAQHVYKCVDGRNTSYQSLPCEKGKRLARQWQATPEPIPDQARMARLPDTRVQGEQDSRYLRPPARRAGNGARGPRAMGVTISAARDGNRCAKAKKRRDDTERRQGLDRTYESMQRLSKLVSEACR